MDFFEWVGSPDKATGAERDAQLAYARSFALVTVFVQTTALLFSVANYLAAVVLALWTAFLVLCLGLPPAPSFLPKATSPIGHLVAGATIALAGIVFQLMLFSVVSANVSKFH